MVVEDLQVFIERKERTQHQETIRVAVPEIGVADLGQDVVPRYFWENTTAKHWNPAIRLPAINVLLAERESNVCRTGKEAITLFETLSGLVLATASKCRYPVQVPPRRKLVSIQF